MKLALALALVACSRRAPLASCDDDLQGVYVAEGERWMVLDNGATLEAYPLFPDGDGPATGGTLPAGVVAAPRVIDLARPTRGAPGAPGAAASTAPGADPQRPTPPGTLAGTLRRRYMRRQERCDAHVPVHLTRCAGDTLELVLADPSPPLDYAPCTWSRPGPSRLVRWRRE